MASEQVESEDRPSVRRKGGMGERDYALVRLSRRTKKAEIEAESIKAERDALAAERDALIAERDRLKSLADSNTERKRADALQAELRGIRHKQAFGKLVQEQGADPDVVEDLWTLSGYKPETDTPDEDGLATLVQGLKESKPKWFVSRDGSGTSESAPKRAEFEEPPARPSPKPGPASGRSGGGKLPGPEWIHERDLRDPEKMIGNPTFQAKLKEALKDPKNPLIIYEDRPRLTGSQ